MEIRALSTWNARKLARRSTRYCNVSSACIATSLYGNRDPSKWLFVIPEVCSSRWQNEECYHFVIRIRQVRLLLYLSLLPSLHFTSPRSTPSYDHSPHHFTVPSHPSQHVYLHLCDQLSRRSHRRYHRMVPRFNLNQVAPSSIRITPSAKRTRESRSQFTSPHHF